MVEPTVPLAGPLHVVTVGQVLESLAADQRTGLVRFQGDDQRIVCLTGGEIYLATSASGPSIHQIVVGSGATPEGAWNDAAGTSGGISDALAADDRVDGERLRAVLYEHTVSTLVELLVPGTESYEFLADQAHQIGTRFCFPVAEVLTDAGRRLDVWRAISSTLPSTSTLVRRSPTLPRSATTESLTAVEWQVIMAMPAEGTVAEVIAAAGLNAFTVFDVLHRLVRRGLVQAVQGDPSAR